MIRVFLICGVLGLAACGGPQVVEGELQAPVAQGAITTEAEFLATIANRPLATANAEGELLGGEWLIAADGTWSGTAGDGTQLAGTWEWDGSYWCRDITSGVTGAPPQDCQQMVMQSNGLALVTRDRGNGASFYYTVG